MNDACAALPFSSSVAVAEFPLVQNPSVALRQPHVALMLNPRIHAFTCSLPNPIRYLTSILPNSKTLILLPLPSPAERETPPGAFQDIPSSVPENLGSYPQTNCLPIQTAMHPKTNTEAYPIKLDF